jgi:hypothetical protein
MPETINEGREFSIPSFSLEVYSLFIFSVFTLSLSINQQIKNQKSFTNNYLNQFNLACSGIKRL